MDWYVGCSGFQYKEWKGIFYSEGMPQRKWLEYYCDHFDTLELNVTFYRFPQLSFLESWYNRSPGEFRFSVKVPRTITHYQHFINSEPLLNEFYALLSKGLSDKLGPVLFQLPPKYQYTPERLQQILQIMDTDFENVIEFRHSGWWCPEVTEALTQKNITFCGASYPGLPEDTIVNAPVVYYRFHGIPKLYYSPYSENALQKVADAIQQQSRSVQKAYLYFNNTANASAIENATVIKKYINSFSG